MMTLHVMRHGEMHPEGAMLPLACGLFHGNHHLYTVILHYDWLSTNIIFTQCRIKHLCRASFSFQGGWHYDESQTQQNYFNIDFVIVDVFGSFNMQIDTFFPRKSTCISSFAFIHIVKRLSAKLIGSLSTSTVRRWFFTDNF